MRARFFGQFLLGNGTITAPQLLAATEYQERNNPRLGEIAVSLGYATPFDVAQIRSLQAKKDLLFGDAALQLGVLTDAQVQRIIEAQEHRHVSLGKALVALGYLSREQVEAAASEFLTEEARIEPEVVTIPDDLPLREVAFELFHLTHKLLLRVCNLTSKTEKLRVLTDLMPLSDRNACVGVSGAFQSGILLCLPHEIAYDMASSESGDAPPTESDADAIVCELASLLCSNLQSVLAERGMRIELGSAEIVGPRVSLPPGRRVAVVPFLTHKGQVLVSLALPSQPIDA
jgi:CheY-specific phosphatase CheX